MEMPRPVVSVKWLAEHLGHPDLVIADCRMIAGDSQAGRRAHAASHIPGAVYFHMADDMGGRPGPHGGRLPLPEPEVIAAKLGAAGIGPGVRVVCYDISGENAARMWFVLRWLGHDDVAVLDGGWNAWMAAGQPLETEAPRPQPRTFVPSPRPELVVSMEEVRDRSPGVVVVDARAPERFAGRPHPLDPTPGHIPGAVNRFYREAFRPDGTYRTPEELAARYADLPPGESVIHSCGSGVTACVNMIAGELAGLKGARLYVGSWSDWSSYPDNPIEKE